MVIFSLPLPEKKKGLVRNAMQIQDSRQNASLGGGNSNIFGIFTPKFGEDEPNLTSIFFSKGLVQPATRRLCKESSPSFAKLLQPASFAGKEKVRLQRSRSEIASLLFFQQQTA